MHLHSTCGILCKVIIIISDKVNTYGQLLLSEIQSNSMKWENLGKSTDLSKYFPN